MSVWAVYARVSTEEQAKFGASLASQIEAATDRALALGAGEVITFVDEGVPGDVLGRPGITRLREAMANRSIAGLVVYDPDRLARNLAHQLLLTEEIQTAGVKLEFVNFEWKDTDEGRLFYSIRGAIAEYEKAKIRERTTRGKWAKVKQGYSPNGRVPYGYLFDKPSRTISVNPETAAWVKQIFFWIAREGLGPQRLANRLNALNVPPPQRASQWGTSSLRHIIRNPAYKGRQVVHKYNTEGTHKNPHLPKEQRIPVLMRAPEDWLTIPIPQLIDEPTWALAQAAMGDLRHKHAGRPGKHFFLLQRIAACGICGASLYGARVNRALNSRYYRCTSQVNPRLDKCGLPHMPADQMEATVWELVLGWATDLEQHARAVATAAPAASAAPVALAAPAASAQPPTADLSHLQNQLTAVQQEQAQLSALVSGGLVKPEHVSGAIRELSQRAGTLAQMIEQFGREAAINPGWNPGDCRPLTRDDLAAWAPAQRQELVKRYIEEVHAYPDGKLRVVPRVGWS
ncbi:MAG: PinR [Firmicutes bacterium]|nr:PinR [Bacillota bacterium]